MFTISIAIRSLTFNDLLPGDPKMYDKMRPPKKDGKLLDNREIGVMHQYIYFVSFAGPTIVYFHVTVMGLDSIDETSMV